MIVLIIGESYNKHHAQLYGYDLPTTPRQLVRQRTGQLIAFSDVVTPWNLTSFVFKHMLSTHVIGQEGQWSDYPMMPVVFRKAGYDVTFLTNQFLPKAKDAVYDFSGGFFLNDPEFSKRQFDTRNSRTYRYDETLLKAYDALKGKPAKGRLTILHLMGSHVDYRARYPKQRQYFTPSMYQRPELTDKQRRILSDYDNSLRYNDSILWAITQRFMDKDAVVIYVPDHAEEIFDGKPYMYGRMHGANIDYRLARNEMEIPFWIWGSPRYIERHPYGWEAIQDAKDRPLMTDVLPHLLLYLGGISTPLYHPEYNVITPEYNTRRPRILKGVTDYNKLKK
jgi:heptose-I-phosphate ethanolaminephosphotransferase